LSRTAFQQLVLLSLVPGLLSVIVLVVGAREAPAPPAGARPSLRLAAFDRRFRIYLAIVVLFTLGNSSDAFLILRAQDAGLSVPAVLGMMMTFNLVYTLTASPAGALSDRLGRRRLLTVGWLVYAFVYLGFACLRTGWQAWGLMAVYGAYYGLTEGAARAFVADLVPAELRGSAYGMYHAAIGLAAFPASLLAGILWQGAGGWAGFGPAAPFLFGGALALAAALLLPAVGTLNRSPVGGMAR
jgi:MFS family permease